MLEYKQDILKYKEYTSKHPKYPTTPITFN